MFSLHPPDHIVVGELPRTPPPISVAAAAWPDSPAANKLQSWPRRVGMAKRLQIYGQPSTRTNRPLWMAHELGLDFENVPVVLLAPDEDDLNPNRKQPYLVDTDGTTVFESLAINLYLVRQNPAHELSPRSSAEEAKLLQWTMCVPPLLRSPKHAACALRSP